jgi:hypothetical protein
MTRPVKTTKDSYSAAEAAAELKVSVDRLHHLLDRKIFNDGSPRPATLNFQSSDLILLRFWLEQDQPKLIQMPPRMHRRGTGTDDFDSER